MRAGAWRVLKRKPSDRKEGCVKGGGNKGGRAFYQTKREERKMKGKRRGGSEFVEKGI